MSEPTGSRSEPLRATAADARRQPFAPEDLAATVWRRGTMSLEHYAPRRVDTQHPHDQDELYVVIAGRGTFVCGDRRTDFGPHDVLFVAAGVPHRFEEFSADFETWVMFYGPKGGEPAAGVNL